MEVRFWNKRRIKSTCKNCCSSLRRAEGIESGTRHVVPTVDGWTGLEKCTTFLSPNTDKIRLMAKISFYSSGSIEEIVRLNKLNPALVGRRDLPNEFGQRLYVCLVEKRTRDIIKSSTISTKWIGWKWKSKEKQSPKRFWWAFPRCRREPDVWELVDLESCDANFDPRVQKEQEESARTTAATTYRLYRVIRNDCRGFNNLPPRSPDATPCDFFVWGYVKDQVYESSSSRKYPGTEGTNQNRH